MAKSRNDVFVAHYGKLIGKTIKGVVIDPTCSDGLYGLQFTDGSIAWVMTDPEGNGPGFLDIVEEQKKAPKDEGES